MKDYRAGRLEAAGTDMPKLLWLLWLLGTRNVMEWPAATRDPGTAQ